jgi:hypothetical protein
LREPGRIYCLEGGQGRGTPIVGVCNPVVAAQKWELKVIKRAVVAPGERNLKPSDNTESGEERALVQIRNVADGVCVELIPKDEKDKDEKKPLMVQPVLRPCMEEGELAAANVRVGDVQGEGGGSAGGAAQLFAVQKFKLATHGFKMGGVRN